MDSLSFERFSESATFFAVIVGSWARLHVNYFVQILHVYFVTCFEKLAGHLKCGSLPLAFEHPGLFFLFEPLLLRFQEVPLKVLHLFLVKGFSVLVFLKLFWFEEG